MVLMFFHEAGQNLWSELRSSVTDYVFTVWPRELDRSVMKSMDTWDHGHDGIGREFVVSDFCAHVGPPMELMDRKLKFVCWSLAAVSWSMKFPAAQELISARRVNTVSECQICTWMVKQQDMKKENGLTACGYCVSTTPIPWLLYLLVYA